MRGIAGFAIRYWTAVSGRCARNRVARPDVHDAATSTSAAQVLPALSVRIDLGRAGFPALDFYRGRPASRNDGSGREAAAGPSKWPRCFWQEGWLPGARPVLSGVPDARCMSHGLTQSGTQPKKRKPGARGTGRNVLRRILRTPVIGHKRPGLRARWGYPTSGIVEPKKGPARSWARPKSRRAPTVSRAGARILGLDSDNLMAAA